MKLVIISSKPLQTLNLIFLLGSINVKPHAIVLSKPAKNSIAKFLTNEYSVTTTNALKLQCNISKIAFRKVNKITSINTIKFLTSLKIDLILTVGINEVVNSNFINTSKYGVISSHGGMLPKYRGVDCLKWSVINKEKYIGISKMFLNSGIDTGNIINVCKINLKNQLPTDINQLQKNYFIILNFLTI